MKADYDSEADAISISIVEVDDDDLPASGDTVHKRCIVAHLDGVAIDVELLYPGDGVEEPLNAAAKRYGLDAQALHAAARSAIAAPDRLVSVDVSEPLS